MAISLFVFLLLCKIITSNEECGVLKHEGKPPWTVGFYLEKGDVLELICLGTIFKSNFVVTAAHCLCESSSDNLRKDTVYVVSEGITKTIPISYREKLQKVEQSNIILNTAYKGGIGSKGDIAVTKLDEGLNSTPVCLDWEDNIYNLQHGDWLKQSIWQGDKVGLIDVSCVNLEVCRESATSSFAKLITNDKVCMKPQTEISPHDILAGGGLLYLNFIDNLWYLRGVASFQDVDKQLLTYSSINIFLNWLTTVSARV